MRAKLALLHLGASLLIVGLTVGASVMAWYPPPLAQLQGVMMIIGLIVLVDVCLGPLATFAIASPAKAQAELRRDIATVVVVQILALGYGLWTVYVARPAYLVFNANRFDVVQASELETELLGSRRGSEFDSPRFGGPIWVLAEQPESIEERNRILFDAAAGGADIKNYPHLYKAWPGNAGAVRRKLQPLDKLKSQRPESESAVRAALSSLGLGEADVSWLPIVGRDHNGVVLVRNVDLTPLKILDVDPG